MFLISDLLYRENLDQDAKAYKISSEPLIKNGSNNKQSLHNR